MKENLINWVKTGKMVNEGRKMTIKFHNREVNEDLVQKGEF